MKKSIGLRISTLCLSAVIAFEGMNRECLIKAEDIIENPWLMVYDFDNNLPGYAKGTITLGGVEEDHDYELYWLGKDGKKLKRDGVYYSELGTISISEGEGSYEIVNDYQAIPYGACGVGMFYGGDEPVESCVIPESKRFNATKKKYSFGVFSDIHYNRYVTDWGLDCGQESFEQCMEFFEDTAKVSFVTGVGDISKNGETSAFRKYSNVLALHKKLPVYTCMGNHDMNGKKRWKEYVNEETNKKNAKKKGILNVSDNGLNFVYQNPAHKDEVFIFVSQDYVRGPGVVKPLMSDDTLNWMSEMLATYSDKNVFLYFHTYLSDSNGDVTKGVGNILAPNGYTYDLTYPVGTKDEVKFKKLLTKYANVTMFSGHSHWAYDNQIYNPNLNIGSLGQGATLVHVSSVGDPRGVRYENGAASNPTIFFDDSKDRIEGAGLRSESMVVDVYDGVTVYNGVENKDNEYLAYAVYMSKEGSKKKPESMAGPKKTKVTVTRKNEYSTKAKITWAKRSDAKGYEVSYSTSKKFTKKTTVTKTVKKASVTIKGLKAGGKYYVRVRSYKVKYGKNRYSDYSKVKTLSIKKK